MDTNIDFPFSREVSNLKLFHETEQEKAQWVGMAANQQDNMRPLHVHNEAPPTYSQHKKEVINIQLPYDPQAPTEPDLWNGSFHPIFFMAPLNTLHQTPRALKCLSTSLLSTLGTNRSMVTWLTISLILMVWVMSYGTLSLRYTMLNGTLSIPTTKLTLSEPRFHQNLLWEQSHNTMATRRILQNRSQLQSTRFCLLPSSD